MTKKQSAPKAAVPEDLPMESAAPAPAEAVTDSQEAVTPSAPATPERRNSVQEEAAFEKTVSDMKAVLDAQPKVRILVPLEGNEKLGAFHPVTINGYRLNVPKGVYVAVPQTVADIISEAFNVYEQNSATAMRTDRDEKVDAALTI